MTDTEQPVVLPPLNSAHPLAVASNDDTYFVGHDLEAAKRLVLRDRWCIVGQNKVGHWFVQLTDTEPANPTPAPADMEWDGNTAEWGAGETEEIAWRFALGAAMGPIDLEYDESRLIAMLQTA